MKKTSPLMALIAWTSIVVLGACADTTVHDNTSEVCIEQGPALAAQCVPGSNWQLLASGVEQCGLNGVYQPLTGSAEAGGQCQSSGTCDFACTISAELCECGIADITRDSYTCSTCPGEACTPGEVQCINGRVSECLASSGIWSTATDCPTGKVCQLTEGRFSCIDGVPFGQSTSGECGDGDLNGAEECDNGEANSDTEPDACRTACVEASCGDGVVDSNEDCEPEGPVPCSSNCNFPEPVCDGCEGNQVCIDDPELPNQGNGVCADVCDFAGERFPCEPGLECVFNESANLETDFGVCTLPGE